MAKKQKTSSKSAGTRKAAKKKPAKRSTAGKRKTASKSAGKAKATAKTKKPAAKKTAAKKKTGKKKSAKKSAAKGRSTGPARRALDQAPAQKSKSVTSTTRTRRGRSEPQYEVEQQVKNPKITKRQMETIERNLMAERDRLVGEMARLHKSEYEQMTSGQSHRFANHQADVASDMSILDTMLIQSGIEADRLRQVQDALERMEAGQLGICERCGANVGYDRMLAKPFARYCIVCRAHLEKRQRSSRIL